MRVAIIAWTPIAGAPWQQWNCLQKYGKEYCPNLQVRYIQQRNRYGDGRVFPADLLLSSSQAKNWIRNADVVHIHNYLPKELTGLVDPKKQRVVLTLHSCPRQGTWKQAMAVAHATYCIRQNMQMREYKDFPTLPNMYDVWEHKPAPKREFDVIKIVYCPSNKLPTEHVASKAYNDVMPVLNELKDRKDVELIHFTNVAYLENIKRKQPAHIVIDDICQKHDTFHLTSLEGASHAQAVLTSLKTSHGYPFIETTPATLRSNLLSLLNDKQGLYKIMKESRAWAEEVWDPKIQVQEFIEAYQG